MAISAGKLRQRLSIERPPCDEDRDRVGQPNGEWEFVARVSANIAPVDSSQTFADAQLRTVGTHLITIRYRADIESGWRFRFEDLKSGKCRYFVTTGSPVCPEERREHLECVCQEVG